MLQLVGFGPCKGKPPRPEACATQAVQYAIDYRMTLPASRFPGGKPRVSFHEPSRNRAVQFGQMPREEVVSAGDNDHFCIFPDARRKLLDHRAQLRRRAEAVEFAGHQKLRFIAGVEIREAAAVQIAD